jgi:hypothetical protein
LNEIAAALVVEFKTSQKQNITMNFNTLFLLMFAFGLAACGTGAVKTENPAGSSPYHEDVAFQKKYGEVIELSDAGKKSRVAVMPGLQGRVMTSTAGAPDNSSFGWIHKAFFESGDTSVHMNAFGGEERFWIGPEGGQFSIFFKKDSAFTFDHWHTPRLIDLEAYDVVNNTGKSVTFSKTAELENYSGTRFSIKINRQITVLDPTEAFQQLGVAEDANVISVAYQTVNEIENTGDIAWSKKTGLLSIWLLGMFNPSASLTMVIPYNEGQAATFGPVVNDNYFGKVPADRLKVGKGVLYFRGDGEYRSKIGLNPLRGKGVMGSYDQGSKTLTIVKYTAGEPSDVYVNSKWEIQSEPFKGDVVNAYNDGPPAPGEKPMGPFYELESSSPARELKPGERITQSQTTFHFQGDEKAIDALAIKVLGVSLAEITSVFVASK